MTLLGLIPHLYLLGFLGLIFAISLYFYIKRYPKGNALMQEIAESIHSGSMIFIKREYTFIFIFAMIRLLRTR